MSTPTPVLAAHLGDHDTSLNHIISVCDVLMLQETWLLKSQIGSLNQYFTQHNSCCVSGINENVLLLGRPYGSCCFLYKQSLDPSIICSDVGSDRLCCNKLNTKFGMRDIFNEYMSCDTTSNDHIEEYNYVLSRISTCVYQNAVEYCIITGDLNTDLMRHSSGSTISLNSFIEHEHLAYVLKLLSNNVSHTFTSIKYTK